ncbi:MAG: HEAT repeat domain-containing protein [Deltaproteobacteria bacterium]|nr:HEAT repeat domain-containing protein [Deltaproteobacteria bacterium]
MNQARFAALVLFCVGCGPKAGLPPTPALPVDAVVVEVPTPLQVLDAAAASLDPSTRGQALGHLVATDPAPGAAGWAQRGLHDPEPWVQRQVVEALAARLDEPETVQVLEGYTGREGIDPHVRACAAIRLVEHGHTDVAEVLSTAWRAEGSAWRRAPLALAAVRLGDSDALSPLSRALSRGEIALEVEFMLEVGRSGLVDLVPALQEGTEWVEPELLLAFAAARLALGDTTAETELRRALSSSEILERLEALDYLSRLRGPTAEALLRRARLGPGVVRWYASLALLARGEGDPDLFERAMASDDREVRALSVRFAGMAEHGEEGGRARKIQRSARTAVRLGLADQDAVVRRSALEAIAHLGLEGEEPWLEAALLDDDLAIRVAAAGTMRRLAVRAGGDIH